MCESVICFPLRSNTRLVFSVLFFILEMEGCRVRMYLVLKYFHFHSNNFSFNPSAISKVTDIMLSNCGERRRENGNEANMFGERDVILISAARLSWFVTFGYAVTPPLLKSWILWIYLSASAFSGTTQNIWKGNTWDQKASVCARSKAQSEHEQN